MIRKPPSDGSAKLIPAFEKILASDETRKATEALVRRVQKDYPYWDKFRHYPMPPGITTEEGWIYLRFTRTSNAVVTPVRTADKQHFRYNLTPELQKRMEFIGRQSAGRLLNTTEIDLSDNLRKYLVLNGLADEAIASSQIEGASTSRKAAREMILSRRKPRTEHEQMIINNFQVMQRLHDWKDVPLSRELLLEIQANIMTDVAEDPGFVGRFRTDTDNIVVGGADSDVYEPPAEKLLHEELLRLIDFANEDSAKGDYVHPVIKASILHFWLAYLHPFPDGNGRTARAIFYWYMLRNDYWLFEWLSVSRVIKSAHAQYDRAFLYSEFDNDLTYFLLFITRSVVRSIELFTQALQKRLAERAKANVIMAHLKQFNFRQASLLHYLRDHPGETIDFVRHQTRHDVTYQTARADLLKLEEAGALTRIQKGKKFVFVPDPGKVRELLKAA